ncbi:MAG: DUF4864 domain-containing protein [Rhodospirillales bacterium]|nr:DUF4864 domain-containing protein [Alphaproteobacteria bacterium]MBL6948133.1 DUF4864 domain-containing protein [Rhodospirillales bacterium]
MTNGPTMVVRRWVLRRIRSAALMALVPLVGAGVAEAAGSGRELRNDVIGVLKRQIEAFRRDDGKAAFSYASPDVQDQYGSAASFLSRFASTYKAVYRPQSVTFLNLAYSRGRLVQRVLLLGPDGNAVIALFPMVKLDDGSWRMDGCVLVPATGKRADLEEKPGVLG